MSTATVSPQADCQVDISRAWFWLLMAFAMLLALGIGLYLMHFRFFYSISADESGRTMASLYWNKVGGLPLSEWLTFPHMIMGTAMKMTHETFFTVRYISIVLGMIALAGLMWMSHELIGCRAVTATTGILGALFPHRVVLSNVPLAEVYVLAATLPALALIARWLKEPKSGLLIAAGLLMGIANAVRFENWIGSGFFLLLALGLKFHPHYRHRIALWSIAGFAILIALFPTIWMWRCYVVHHDAFHSSRGVINGYLHYFGPSRWNMFRNGGFVQFLNESLLLFTLPALLPLLWMARLHRTIRLWLLPHLAGLIVVGIMLPLRGALPEHNFWRLSISWSLLLLPFLALLIWQYYLYLRSNWPQYRRLAGWLAGLGLLFYVIHFGIQSWDRTADSKFPLAELRVGRKLYEIFNTDKSNYNILVEAYTWSFLNIGIAASQPMRFVTNTIEAPGRPPKRELITGNRNSDMNNIRMRNTRYLVASDRQLRQRIEQLPSIQLIYDASGWAIYRVNDLNAR